jgi:hypothetical protein
MAADEKWPAVLEGPISKSAIIAGPTGQPRSSTSLASTTLRLITQQLVPNSRIGVGAYVVSIGAVNAIWASVNGWRPERSERTIATQVRLARLHLGE